MDLRMIGKRIGTVLVTGLLAAPLVAASTDGYCEKGRICFWTGSYQTGTRYTYRISYTRGFYLGKLSNAVRSIRNNSGEPWVVYDRTNCDPAGWWRTVSNGQDVDSTIGTDWDHKVSSTAYKGLIYSGPVC